MAGKKPAAKAATKATNAKQSNPAAKTVKTKQHAKPATKATPTKTKRKTTPQPGAVAPVTTSTVVTPVADPVSPVATTEVEANTTTSETASGKRERGRPTAFTDDVKNRILAAVSGGSTLSDAAAFAGIAYETLRRWVRQGEEEEKEGRLDGEFCGFCVSIKKGQADARISSLAVIRQAARGQTLIEKRTVVTTKEGRDGKPITTTTTEEKYLPPAWQAAGWFLERSDPQNWGKRVHNTNRNFNYNLDDLTDEQLRLFDRLLSEGVEESVAYATVIGSENKA
jgi:transposase-like protein